MTDSFFNEYSSIFSKSFHLIYDLNDSKWRKSEAWNMLRDGAIDINL